MIYTFITRNLYFITRVLYFESSISARKLKIVQKYYFLYALRRFTTFTDVLRRNTTFALFFHFYAKYILFRLRPIVQKYYFSLCGPFPCYGIAEK